MGSTAVVADTQDDKVTFFSESALDEAWARVRASAAGPGVDGMTLDAFESDLTAELRVLRADLLSDTYRPQSYRGVDVPKKNGGHRRIVIASIRDRVAQAAVASALVPKVDSVLHPSCFSYRRGVGVHDALARVCTLRDRGLRHVLHSDIERFFDCVQHARLDALLLSMGVSETYRRLTGLWLAAPVLIEDKAETVLLGLPQGLPLSPLLANLYLTPFDRDMDEAGWELTRYADDFLVCCPTPGGPGDAQADAIESLAKLGLVISSGKTQTCSFEEGFEFLGARFLKNDVLPAVPHPYEPDYTPAPAPRPRRPPTQGMPHTMMRTLYLQTQGSRLGCHSGRLVVTRRETTLLEIPSHQIDQVFAFGRINMTAAAVSFCLTRRIPVFFFSGHGRYYGVLQDPAKAGIQFQRAQFALAETPDRRLDCARGIVMAKVRNAASLLAQHARNHPETDLEKPLEALHRAVKRIPHAKDLDALRGMEGAAASEFYGGYALAFRGTLNFTRRVRRPPTDPVNSLLSFAYTLVLYNLYACLSARGLSPAIGVFHDMAAGHPALASDLLEEFRAPIVESLVLSVANRGMFGADDFHRAEGRPQPCLLTDEARLRFLEAFEQKMDDMLAHPDVSYPVSWRRVLDLQALRFRRFVEGKIDAYHPFEAGGS